MMGETGETWAERGRNTDKKMLRNNLNAAKPPEQSKGLLVQQRPTLIIYTHTHTHWGRDQSLGAGIETVTGPGAGTGT